MAMLMLGLEKFISFTISMDLTMWFLLCRIRMVSR
jgi:hypothetical protein